MEVTPQQDLEVEETKEAVKRHQPEEDLSSDEVVEEESSLKRRATFPRNAISDINGNGNGISTLTTEGSSVSSTSTENASWAFGVEFDSAPKSNTNATAEPIIPEEVVWEDEDDDDKPPPPPPQDEEVEDASWDTSLEFDSAASKSKTSTVESVILEQVAGDEENGDEKPPPRQQEEVEDASWDSSLESKSKTSTVGSVVPEEVAGDEENGDHEPPPPKEDEEVENASCDTSVEFDSTSNSNTTIVETIVTKEVSVNEENSDPKPPPPPEEDEEVENASWDTIVEFDSTSNSNTTTVETIITKEVAENEEKSDQNPPPPEEDEEVEDASWNTSVEFGSTSKSNTINVEPITTTKELSGDDQTDDQKPPPSNEVPDASWDTGVEFDSASKSTNTTDDEPIISEGIVWDDKNDDQNQPPAKLEVMEEENEEVGGSSYIKREDKQIAIRQQQGTHDEIDWSQLNVKREDLAAKFKDVDIDLLISQAFDWKEADVEHVEYREFEGSTSEDITLKEGERVIYEMEESDEEVVELEFERAVEKIHAHDGYNMYCPNCSSQITRVVLRRKIRQRKILVASEKGRQDLLGCLSCFSVFIPAGDKLNPFRIFGHGRDRDQTVQLQEEQLPTSDVPVPTLDEAVPVPAPVTVLDSTEAEGKRFDCFWFFKKKRAREDDLTTPLLPAPELEPALAPATATTVSTTVYSTETKEETIEQVVETCEETIATPQEQPTPEETSEIPQEQQQPTTETAKTTEKGFDLFWFFKRRRVEETDLTTPLIPAAAQIPSTTTMFTSTTTTVTSKTKDENIKEVTPPTITPTPTEIQTTTTTVISKPRDEAIKQVTHTAVETTRTTVTSKTTDEAIEQVTPPSTTVTPTTIETTTNTVTSKSIDEDIKPFTPGAKRIEEDLSGDFKEIKVITTTTVEEKTVRKFEGTAAAAAVASAAAVVEKVTQTTPPTGSVLDGNVIIDVREKLEEFIRLPKTPAKPELEVKQEYQPPGDLRIPIVEAPPVTEIPMPADTAIAVTTTTEIINESRPPMSLDILKSIVYGGLMESIISLVIVSIAVALNSTTMNVVAIGLACLVGGFFLLIHDLRALRYGHPSQTNDQRYYDHLGRKELFPLHVTVAVTSYLIFGLLPPVLFGFTFRATDDREFKIITVASAAFLCIAILAIAQTYVRGERTFLAYFKTVLYYIILAAIAAGAAFGIGYLVKDPFPCPTVLGAM